MRWPRHAWVVGLLAAGLLPAITTIREGLWVDELHTQWTCQSAWSQLVERAAQGNQSPLFFGLEKILIDTVGSLSGTRAPDGEVPEWLWRVLPCLAWGAMLILAWQSLPRLVITTAQASGIVAPLSERGVFSANDPPLPRHSVSSPGRWKPPALVLAIGCAWLFLDRIGLFYAVEARPYAWVALLSLGLIWASQTGSERQGATTGRFAYPVNWNWIAISLALVYSHYTALLAVLASGLGRGLALLLDANADRRTSQRGLIGIAIDLAWIGAGLLPVWSHLGRLFEQRSQWTLMTQDTSIATGLSLMPVLPWVVVPWLICVAMEGAEENRVTQSSTAGYRHWFLQCAMVAVVPVFLVWALSNWAGTPLMHRRYVLASYPALLMLGGHWICRARRDATRCAILFLSCVILVVQQGTWRVWQSGEWFGWQRGEDWKGAVRLVEDHRQADDQIWIAPMLVETATQGNLESKSKDYLAFPYSALRSKRESIAGIQILPNQAHDWVSIVSQATPDTRHRHWVVARLDRRSMEAALEILRRSTEKSFQVSRHEDFGTVQVVELQD